LRVAIYARVSTEEQAQNYGLGSQLHAMRTEAARRGYKIIEEYVDDGYSGASEDRPAMNRLREAARAQVFDVVMFPALDRLARSVVVQNVILNELRRLDVGFEFLNVLHGEDTPEFRLQLNNLGSFAEYERESIVRRMVRGKREKARLGKVAAPGDSPYGYEPELTKPGAKNPGKLLICEREAEVVRLIYKLCVDEGKSIEKIVRELQRLGLPARKGQWGTTQVARILNDERYIGTVYYGKQKVRPGGRRVIGAKPIPIPIPPIVTPERRQAALDQLRKNRAVLVGRPANFRYMLSGLVRCAHCNVRYNPDPNKGRRAYRHARIGTCRTPQISADLAEKEVWAAIKEALQSPQALLEAAHAYEAGRGAASVEIASNGAFLRKQIDKIQGKEKRLIRAIADAVDDAQGDLFQAELRQLGNDRRRLADQLRSAEEKMATSPDRPRDVEALIAQACQGIDELNEQGSFDLLRDVVDEIKVDRNHTLTIIGVLEEAGKSTRDSSRRVQYQGVRYLPSVSGVGRA